VALSLKNDGWPDMADFTAFRKTRSWTMHKLQTKWTEDCTVGPTIQKTSRLSLFSGVGIVVTSLCNLHACHDLTFTNLLTDGQAI
jgi:hypothetical protein